MKVDLHVHSKFSQRPSQWILKKINCPESFTQPLQIYKTARQRGMSYVTISDHNTISGALEIAHLPNTFISQEITSYFPEDRCKIHILAFNITEDHHKEFQKLRQNVFELVEYLNKEHIVHSLAHPLYSINDLLTIDHFEKLLLLFKNFELNGARNHNQNQSLRFILSNLTPIIINDLKEKHNYEPLFTKPWEKNLTAGSDDHSGLNIARTYTLIKGAKNLNDIMSGIQNNNTKILGISSTPKTMAHNFYGIAYQFYKNKFNLDHHIHKDRILQFFDKSLNIDPENGSGLISKIYFFLNKRKQNLSKNVVPDTLMDLIRKETDRILYENPKLANLTNNIKNLENRETNWFNFVNQVSNKVLYNSANHLFDHLSGANVFNIFQAIGSAAGLYTVLAPYFVSYAQFSKDKQLHESILQKFSKDMYEKAKKGNGLKVGHFTDTFYDINGVAKTLQQQVKVALQNHKKLTIITCDVDNHEDQDGVKNFKPIGTYELSEYREQKLYYPPFLDMLDFCYEQKFTHIHSATPGPIGLAALAISYILKLPITSTYHTAFPQYAKYLTGDSLIEDLTWRYIVWYYEQMDMIYVSAQNSADELIAKGINPQKIKIFPRGINTQLFKPFNNNNFLATNYDIKESIKLLYVGRISKEKNLHILVDAFKLLLALGQDIHLVVVGCGPYLMEMKSRLRNDPCTFTGYMERKDLPSIYTSSDIFVFPSTTDTFGNVVLEAQSCGIPVIITDKGGPAENVLPNKTGLVVKGNDPDLFAKAILNLIKDKSKRKNMGIAARQYMKERSFENAFIRTWDMFKDVPYNVETDFFAKTGS